MKYNLGTHSNPIFKEMFSRHATSAGALVLAADLIKKNIIMYLVQVLVHIMQNKLWQMVFVILMILQLQY